MKQDPLRPRLFGYGLLYPAHLSDDWRIDPLAAAPGPEAGALAAALARMVGAGAGPTWRAPAQSPAGQAADLWCVSVPFGRCGLAGRPREHIRVHGAVEAYHDALGPEGYRQTRLSADQTVAFEPGLLHRLRARPGGDGRVLVAFQTEDRTPLHGHAAPVSRRGEGVAAHHPARLAGAWQAFEGLRELAAADPEAYRAELVEFMGRMAVAVAGDPEMARIQTEAEAAGTYELADQEPLFQRQAALLTPEVIQRVAAADSDLFRFPGMFGAVAPLFSLLNRSP